MMKALAAYDELLRRTREEALLASCVELLNWDEETYMPPAGVEHRSAQLALLAGLRHVQATDPRIGDLLTAVEGSDLLLDPLAPPAVNVREWRRRYERGLRLPRSLVEELMRVATMAQQQWVLARRDADFARFRPWLEKIVALKRAEAEALGYEESPYDALLEEFEPGARRRQLAVLFAELYEALVPLAANLRQASRQPHRDYLDGEFALDRQQAFVERTAARLGFDFRRGRLDTTTHPFFSAIGPDDCRISTRYHPRRFSDGFFSMLHEVGHGLYEQGLDREHHGTPMGEVPSLALHESQARLWENLVGRSRGFWQYFLPQARQVFPEMLRDVSFDGFFAAVNRVEPTCIRVGADEVTYNLHILVRFELEQALLSGNLPVADLPSAWNEAYRNHLGILPADDAEGCLQDGHWAVGMIGYFPTYTLGNLFAAQLFAQASADLDDLPSAFARGDFTGLVGWLSERIYRQGGRFSAAQLVERVTGQPPGPCSLLRTLHRKYHELYGIE
jgi:carboxypeptidase Taq